MLKVMPAGDKIKLRPTETKDLEIFRMWINDPDVGRGLLRHLPVSDWEHKAWFEAIKKDKSQIYFSIEMVKDKKYIGNVGLKNINWRDRNGELFIYIGEKEDRGNGYGLEAVKAFVDYCFNALNLHKVCLRVAEDNRGAIKTYLKAGFKKEGLSKDDAFRGGKYLDVVRMGIINKK